MLRQGGDTMSEKENKSTWAIGGGVLLGIGVGFFFLPNTYAFVGSIMGRDRSDINLNNIK